MPVGGDNHCHQRATLDRGPEPLNGVIVQGPRRLVQHKEPRLADKGPSERQLLDHAARVAVDSLAGEIRDVQLVDEVRHRAARTRNRVSQPREGQQVDVAGEAQIKRPLLRKRHADEGARLACAGEIPRDPHLTAAGRQGSGDATQKGRLAGAIWSNDRHPLARCNLRVKWSQHLAATERAGHSANGKHLLPCQPGSLVIDNVHELVSSEC